jgi:hypothetical protein
MTKLVVDFAILQTHLKTCMQNTKENTNSVYDFALNDGLIKTAVLRFPSSMISV